MAVRELSNLRNGTKLILYITSVLDTELHINLFIYQYLSEWISEYWLKMWKYDNRLWVDVE